jgi:hypothetical protein
MYNKKFMVIALLLIVVSFSVGGLFFFLSPTIIPSDEQVYQGPVRPTDDEAHFRLTGETIPLEVKK